MEAGIEMETVAHEALHAAARLPLALEDEDTEATGRQEVGALQATETRSYDDDVVLHVLLPYSVFFILYSVFFLLYSLFCILYSLAQRMDWLRQESFKSYQIYQILSRDSRD